MNKSQFEKLSENERMNSVLFGTFYYPCVHRPNTAAAKKFGGDPYFGVSVGLDAENLAKAQEMGLNVKEATDGIPEPHVVIKRKVKANKTEDEVRPEVVDSMQNDIPAHINIGNGSRGYVKFARYWYDTGGGGIGTALFKVQVRDLEEYAGGGDSDLGYDEGGFNVNEFTPSVGQSSNQNEDLSEIATEAAPKKKAKAAGKSDGSIFDDD